ncbi:hypothetical protein K32_23790 [Kaistia sp. 32K]|uniref:right-handed parallel beta-helix repeat-containing protein n=1 Tax=Kaistia sp. 32K TaxID=2795690 RepID=UPI001914F6D3|nr:right-handed parallel beta-helix repeat-containing protein [Kaistia sp. 32K]BCP53762.1 hypothetical protein K32_23790 [Kaistia sp. 32K]
MAYVLKDRARMTTATTGTGAIALGSAVQQPGKGYYQSFAAAGVADGDTFHYVIEDGAAWEIGLGTYTASGSVMARSLVVSSTGALLNLSGAAEVFISLIADVAGRNVEVPLSASATAAANAATLQAAINAASNTTIYLPAGRFALNSVILKPGVRIQGKGKEVTRLLCGSDSIVMLSYTATSTQFYFAIRDVGFEANGKAGAQAVSIDGGSSAIRISNVSIRNIEVSGAFAQGITLRFCANSQITDVFSSQAVIGFQIDNCADTDLVDCRAQNGTGAGFNIIGGPGAFDEGVRLVGCSTNGQNTGLVITGQEWGLASACSFTTCPGGALVVNGASSNWKFSACDFSTAGTTPASANATLGSASSSFSFVGCQFVLGTFGAIVSGADHTFAGNTFFANNNVDFYVVDATGLSVSGNVFRSTAVSWSILETGAANQNVFVGNRTTKLTTLVGAASVALEHLAGFSRVQGGFSRGIPVVKTANFTVASTDNWIVCNKGSSTVVTLPDPSTCPGREIMLKTIQAFTVVSASANVVPRSGSSGGTAILPATAGAWCLLISDNANWVTMQGS